MTHASVFSGIGGPEVAAAMLGWENLFHCEINPFGRAVLQYWFPNAKSYEDITKTDFSEWGGKVNALTGGFPCQPFSYAGQRRGADDDRYLWPFMHRCINQVRPDWVVCENVAGILTMVEQGDVTEMASEKSLFSEENPLHRYRLDETFTLERICNDLESDGYAVQAVVIPACAVNAPHRRDRVFIIGQLDAEPAINGGVLPKSSADTESQQGGRLRPEQPECGEPQQGELGGRNQQDGRGGYAPHTRCTGLEEFQQLTSDMGKKDCRRQTRGHCDGGVQGREFNHWADFPTVSPVHRGNDGIPFPLDDLAISPSKWRTESLKAYGNAIVPQVMYEIFKAIEETYK